MLAILLLFSLLSALLAGVVVLALQSSALLGVGLVVSLFIVDVAFGGLPPLELGVNIFAPDVVFVLLLIASAMKYLTQPRISVGYRPILIWLVLGLGIVISFMVGVSQYGTLAVVVIRDNFYFWSCAFYLMNFSLSFRDLELIFRGMILSAGILCLITLFRWVSDAAGLSDYTFFGAELPYRVMPASASDFIGMAALIAYVFRPGRFSRSLLAIFLSVIVILQHRSVWLATGTAFLVFLFMSARAIKSNLIYFSGVTVLIGIAFIAFTEISGGTSVLNAISVSFVTGIDLSEGTGFARIVGWQALLERWLDADFTVWIFGFPYGTDDARYVLYEHEIRLLEFSAHNFYVQLLYNLGLVGTVAWCTVFAIALWSMWRNSGNTARGRANATLFVLLISSLVFFVSYQGNYLHGIVIGLAIGFTRNSGMAERRQFVGKRELPIMQRSGL